MIRPDARTWFVVGDASRARIFAGHGEDNDWELVEEIDHPAGRARIHDLVTDHPGSMQQTGAAGTKAGMTPRTDPKDVQATHFARLLGERIERARVEHVFDRLVLVAPARFLGLLGRTLGTESTKLVGRRIDKDYTHLPLGEVRDLVGE